MADMASVDWDEILTKLWLSPSSSADTLIHIASLGGTHIASRPNVVVLGPYEILLAALHPKTPEYLTLNDPENAVLERFRRTVLSNELQKQQVERQAISRVGTNFLAVNLRRQTPRILVGEQFSESVLSRLGPANGEPRQLTVGKLLEVIANHRSDEFSQHLQTLYLTPKSLSEALGIHQVVLEPGKFSLSGSELAIDTSADATAGSAPRFTSTDDQGPPPLGEFGNDGPFQQDHDDLGTTVSSPLPDSDVAPGKSLEFDREADRFTLGVETYAQALATVFRQATGEFTFVVFGPWGRGKSFLARRLEDRLKRRTKEQSQEPEIVYDVVRFSAWKYKRTPEAWLFLYETLVKSFRATTWDKRVWRFIREYSQSMGVGKFTWALVAILFTTMPLRAYLHVLGTLSPVIGIVGIIYLTTLIVRSAPKIGALSHRFERLADHKPRLGIQSAVGDDLRALLKAWIPIKLPLASANRKATFWTKWRLFVSAAWMTALFHSAMAFLWVELVFDPLALASTLNLDPCSGIQLTQICGMLQSPSWAAPSAVQWLVLTVWGIAACISTFAMYWPHNDIDRLLLVIDDLDRCSPTETIEIVEAMKLLLEDDEVRERLQVLVLADESVLKHAIAQKFESLIAEKARTLALQSKRNFKDEKGAAIESVVREHMEKLFICHLRLEPLNRQELAAMIETYTESHLERAVAVSNRSDGSSSPQVAAASKAVNVKVASEVGAEDPDAERVNRERLVAAKPEEALTFTDSEIRTLRAYFSQHFSESDPKKPSPRSLRSFMFKYQLCRLLAQLRGNGQFNQAFSTIQVFDELFYRCFESPNAATEPSNIPMELKRLVGQVV